MLHMSRLKLGFKAYIRLYSPILVKPSKIPFQQT